MLALRRASAWGIQISLLFFGLAHAQTPPAPAVKPAAPAPAAPRPLLAPAPASAKPVTPAPAPAAATPAQKPANPPATPPANGQAAQPAQPGQPEPAAPAANLPPPGSVSGTLSLLRGSVPKHGVVYLEGAPTGSWTVPRERVQVAVHGAKLQPEFLVVPVGQTVHFSNNDRIMHSPFSISPVRTFELLHLGPGEDRPLSFEHAGTVDVFCNIHESEQAAIVVAPSTFFAMTAPDGSFVLTAVPAGRYRLFAYAPEAGLSDGQVVDVKPRERTNLRVQFEKTAAPREKGK